MISEKADKRSFEMLTGFNMSETMPFVRVDLELEGGKQNINQYTIQAK
jgi:hypothetical protein